MLQLNMQDQDTCCAWAGKEKGTEKQNLRGNMQLNVSKKAQDKKIKESKKYIVQGKSLSGWAVLQLWCHLPG